MCGVVLLCFSCMLLFFLFFFFFFFNDPPTTEIYTLSLHDALPIWRPCTAPSPRGPGSRMSWPPDRKSTRLNSSHVEISYAVFCLKKKNDKLSSSSQIKKKEHDTCERKRIFKR